MALSWKGYAALRSPTYSLNHEIVGFIAHCRIEPQEMDVRNRLIALIRAAVHDICTQATLSTFGSWDTGLANSSSDIDVQIVRPGKRFLPFPRLIDSLKQSFAVQDYPITIDPSYLRLVHKQTGLEVELYAFDEGRYEECLSHNSKATGTFFDRNPALGALYMVIKHLLKRASLYCAGHIAVGSPLTFADDDEEAGQAAVATNSSPGISGYVLCWLIIAFTQFGLQEMEEDPLLGCNDSQRTIAELVVLFLHYYANVFDYRTKYLQIESEQSTNISVLKRYTGSRPIVKNKRAQLKSGVHEGPNGICVHRIPPNSTLYEIIYRNLPIEDSLLVILNAELGTYVTERVVGYEAVQQLFADTLITLRGYVEGTTRTLNFKEVFGFMDYWEQRSMNLSLVTKGRCKTKD